MLVRTAADPNDVVSDDARFFFFFSSRRRHTRLVSDWSSDVCSSDLLTVIRGLRLRPDRTHGREVLIRARALALERDAEGAELRLQIANADAEDEQIGRASCRERV